MGLPLGVTADGARTQMMHGRNIARNTALFYEHTVHHRFFPFNIIEVCQKEIWIYT